MLGRRVRRGDEIFQLETDAGQRRRLHRHGLRRKGQLARDVAPGNRALLDAEHRPAGLAVQDVHIAGLRGQGERWHGAAVSHDVEQSRWRGRVGVPQVVMDGLKVPSVLARVNVHRDDCIAKQVGPFPISAVRVRDGRCQWQVQKPALLVEREVERPCVHTEAALPAVTFPGVVTDVARFWHGGEFPHLGARPRIKRSWIADASDSPGRTVRPDDEHVLVNKRYRVVWHHHVDFTIRAEAGDGQAGVRVQLDQATSGSEDDPRRLAVPCGRIRDAAS